jgi:putative transposase
MPRHPRRLLPGIPVHLIQRGNNRKVCFFTNRDYIIYLDKLRERSEICGVAIHSYVLMTNHVHLLCTPPRSESISMVMQGLGDTMSGISIAPTNAQESYGKADSNKRSNNS